MDASFANSSTHHSTTAATAPADTLSCGTPTQIHFTAPFVNIPAFPVQTTAFAVSVKPAFSSTTLPQQIFKLANVISVTFKTVYLVPPKTCAQNVRTDIM